MILNRTRGSFFFQYTAYFIKSSCKLFRFIFPRPPFPSRNLWNAFVLIGQLWIDKFIRRSQFTVVMFWKKNCSSLNNIPGGKIIKLMWILNGTKTVVISNNYYLHILHCCQCTGQDFNTAYYRGSADKNIYFVFKLH